MGPKVVEGHILTKNIIKEVTKFELFWVFWTIDYPQKNCVEKKNWNDLNFSAKIEITICILKNLIKWTTNWILLQCATALFMKLEKSSTSHIWGSSEL